MPALAYVASEQLPGRRRQLGLLAQLALGRLDRAARRRRRAARPAARRSPGRLVWRYWRRHSTRSSSSTASTTTAPGCSREIRRNRSSGCPGRATTSSRRATIQSSRCRSRDSRTGHERGPVGERPPPGPAAWARVGPPGSCDRRYTVGRMTLLSLTRDEAASRSSLISVERYDIDVDMTGLLEGERFASTSTVTFTCSTPGSSTFVDIAADVLSATLNGVELDVATAADGRLPLPDLAAHNVLVVEAETTNTAPARASCAPSTRPTSSSTSGPASRPTRPAGCGPASTSPTSRRRTASPSWRRPAGPSPPTPAPSPSTATDARRRAGLALPRHSPALDVRRGGQRRPVPRGPPAARRLRPRLLLPPVAASRTSSATSTSWSP